MADNSGSPDTGFAGKVWPVLRSMQAYRLQFLSHDLFAGLTLAAIAIPEQMATARLGGFAPQIGFFAFLAGSLAFAVFGSNRKFGFWGYFFASLLFTPLIGVLLVIASDKRSSAS